MTTETAEIPLCQRTDCTVESTVFHDFGSVDAKGRTIGARITRYTETYTSNGPDDRGGWRLVPGVYFCFHPKATRDGKLYGASSGQREFATEAERESAVAKYLRDAAKRASKKA